MGKGNECDGNVGIGLERMMVLKYVLHCGNEVLLQLRTYKL